MDAEGLVEVGLLWIVTPESWCDRLSSPLHPRFLLPITKKKKRRGMLVPTTSTWDGLLGKEREPAVAADATAPAAALALGLIYLRTHHAPTARVLDLPTGRAALLQQRPDLLYLRVLAHGLVLWTGVQPTAAYVHDRVPASLRNGSVQWGRGRWGRREAQS